MARHRKRNRLPPFVPIFVEMLDSPAWQLVGNPARVAYLHIKKQAKSDNPGELIFPYSEAEKLMTRKTYSKAIRELEEFGFIKRTQRGGLYRKTNYFTLVDDWKKVQTQVGKSALSTVRKSIPSDAMNGVRQCAK